MKRFWALAALGCVVAGGCRKPQRYVTAERKLRGLVIVLPGIEGRSRLNETICRGLNEGGVNWAIELYDWTTGVPGNYLYHLRARKRNRREAALIARRISWYNARYPGRPVVLVGQSGGGGLAAWVAEAMPSPEGLAGVVMLAPALSPRYDLTAALQNTRRGMVNFYSPKDWVFLGVGTSMWGTLDGEYTSSAGRLSFVVPEAGPGSAPYRKLFQLSWNQEMSEAGHAGGHLSSGEEAFVARYVAPLVRAEKWDEDLMVRVLTQDWAETETPRLPPPERWRVEPVPRNGRPGGAQPRTRPAGAGKTPTTRPPGSSGARPPAQTPVREEEVRWDRLSGDDKRRPSPLVRGLKSMLGSGR